jgi:hypothetical protein
MAVNWKALLVLVLFWAIFALGLDVRYGVAALIAAAVIDWLYVAAPFLPARGGRRDKIGTSPRSGRGSAW